MEAGEALNPRAWCQQDRIGSRLLSLDHFGGKESLGAPAPLLRIASLKNQAGGLTPNGYRCFSKLSQAFHDYRIHLKLVPVHSCSCHSCFPPTLPSVETLFSKSI